MSKNQSRSILFSLLIALVFSSKGQNTLSGTIVSSKNNTPVESVNVLLFRLPDSVYVKGGISNKEGKYTVFDIKEGQYVTSFSYVGFYRKKEFIEIKQDKSFDVSLEEQNKTLNEIIVQGKKPLFEQRIDRLVYNISNSLFASTNNTWEALRGVPGIQMDMQGSVSVQNKMTLIMIDGKLLRLPPEETSNLLKSMQASEIQSIELFLNPPAKYDAEGGALLNIITKKSQNYGFNGTLNLGFRQNTYSKENLGLNFNYRKAKINFYGLYSVGYGNSLRKIEDYVTYSSPTINWNIEHEKVTKALSNTARLGVDFYLNKFNTLGIQTDASFSNNQGLRNVNTYIDNPIQKQFTQNFNDGNFNDFNANFNYRRTFSKQGKELEINVDKVWYKTLNLQNVLTKTDNGTSEFSNNSVQKINIFSAKIDYNTPFGKNKSLSFGGKFYSINTNNDLDFKDKIGDNYVLNPLNTNRFDYTENTQALYASLNQNFKKIKYSAGLRLENTQTEGVSINTNQRNLNDYLRLFPTLYLQYDVNDTHKFNFSYGRRINRPEYWRLNPFQYYVTPFYYLTGNPFLTPAFPESFQLSYMLKNKYIFNLFYNQTKKKFTNITEQDNKNQVYRNVQLNLDNGSTFGMSMILPIRIGSFLEMNNYFQVEQKTEESTFQDVFFIRKKIVGYVRSTSSVMLSKTKNIRAEISAWYSSDAIQGIYNNGSMGDLSLSFRKPIFQNNGNLTLSFSDLFYTNVSRINVDYLDQKNGFIERNDTRMVLLNLSMNIGKKKVTSNQIKRKSNEDEKNRITQ